MGDESKSQVEAARPGACSRLASPAMATTSKQYKAIGEDIWKGRTEKIVRGPLRVPAIARADTAQDRTRSSSRSRTARSSCSSSRTTRTTPR
jgi:hypothetical protein